MTNKLIYFALVALSIVCIANLSCTKPPPVEEPVPEVTPEPEVVTPETPATIAPPEQLTPTAPTGFFGLGDATGGIMLGVIVVVIVGIAWYTTRRI